MTDGIVPCSGGPIFRAHGTHHRTLFGGGHRKPVADNLRLGESTRPYADPSGQAAGCSDDTKELCDADDYLVLADGHVADIGDMSPSTPAIAQDYRRRLEAFFRTSQIAHPERAAARLSAHFGTLSELLNGEPVIIAGYGGRAAATALSQVHTLMIFALAEELKERRPMHTELDATRFLRGLIGFRCDELLVAIFLDSRRCLIDHEIISAGRVDSVDFDLRRILLRALGRGATGIIVAHNHPSGDPRPSPSDLKATRDLAELGRALGICIHDHLVVAGGEVRSAMFH
jgi:DNA repair protein RadC